MSRKHWCWLLATSCALVLAACSAPGDVLELEALPTLAPTDAPPLVPTCEALSGEPLKAGRLALVCEDGNIYVLGPGADPPLAITDDAAPLTGEGGRQYHSPTWSPGGWLSYVKTEVEPDKPTRHLVYAALPGHPPRQLYETSAGSYVYGYWSPAECGQGAGCGRFAFLVSGTNAIELHMAQVSSDSRQVEERLLGEGGPFYYSWAPDGERMLWLRGGTRLEVVEVNDVENSTVLPDVPGIFQAPWWSPTDERLLFAAAGREGNRLVIAEGEKRSDLTGDGGVLSAFAWSPDGRQLANAEGYAPTPYPFTSLSVYSDDGQRRFALTEEALIAFFWSPDSQKLAYVTVELVSEEQPEARASAKNAAPPRQQVLLTWKVANVSDGETRPLASFSPTRSQLYIFQFFDQFAQSHNVWSPDSSQIVYAEELAGGVEAVNVIDVDTPGSQPVPVSAGSLGVFSYH